MRELNELDIKNKQAILDILMDDDLITKKPIKTAEYVKEVNKTKYSYVKSNLNFNTINTYDQDKKNTLGRTGLFEIENQEGNHEYINGKDYSNYNKGININSNKTVGKEARRRGLEAKRYKEQQKAERIAADTDKNIYPLG